jgi:hypothetical protein
MRYQRIAFANREEQWPLRCFSTFTSDYEVNFVTLRLAQSQMKHQLRTDAKVTCWLAASIAQLVSTLEECGSLVEC